MFAKGHRGEVNVNFYIRLKDNVYGKLTHFLKKQYIVSAQAST